MIKENDIQTILAKDLKIADLIRYVNIEYVVSSVVIIDNFTHIKTLNGAFVFHKDSEVNLIGQNIEAFRSIYKFDSPQLHEIEGWETMEDQEKAIKDNKSIMESFQTLHDLQSDLYVLDQRNLTYTVCECISTDKGCYMCVNGKVNVFTISEGFLVEFGNEEMICETSEEIYAVLGFIARVREIKRVKRAA